MFKLGECMVVLFLEILGETEFTIDIENGSGNLI